NFRSVDDSGPFEGYRLVAGNDLYLGGKGVIIGEKIRPDNGPKYAIFLLRGIGDWAKADWSLPPAARPSDKDGDYGLRFIDIAEDGNDAVVFSNEKEYGIYLFTDMQHGWSKKVIAGKAGDKDALPPIAVNGKNNGFFVHSRSLWWINESTNLLKDHADRRS